MRGGAARLCERMAEDLGSKAWCKSQLCFVILIKIVEIYMYIYCIHLPGHRIENPMWQFSFSNYLTIDGPSLIPYLGFFDCGSRSI